MFRRDSQSAASAFASGRLGAGSAGSRIARVIGMCWGLSCERLAADDKRMLGVL